MVIIADTKRSRRTLVSIIYNSKDITADIAPYLLAFTFTDNSKDKADDISLTLEDRAGTWLTDWTPTKGDTLTASIIKQTDDGAVSLPCGSFSVDQIDYAYPPAVMSIKAVSSDIKHTVSQVKHTAYWENISLSGVAGNLAGNNGLSLYLSSSTDPYFERLDQTEQSDLEFLRQLCADYGLGVKVQKSQLVVYELDAFEKSEPVASLTLDDKRLLSFRFTSKSAKVYKKARVIYHDALKDEDYDAESEDDDEEGSERVLVIRERVESQAQARQVAEQRLIDANRKEVTGTLTLTGDVNLAAGVTLSLEGFGAFSGKHFVNKATHKVDGGGYVSTLELGQPKASKGAAKSKKKRKQSRSPKGKTSGGGELYYEGDRYYS